MPTKRLGPSHEKWPLVEQAWALSQQGLIAKDIATSMGRPQGTIEGWLATYRRLSEDPAITAAKQAVGTNMTPQLAWAKTKDDGSTTYSVLLKPDPLPDDTLNRIREAFEGMEPAPPVTPPSQVRSDLCTLYPVMDLHFGMMAWGKETGREDYDIRLAAEDVRRAFGKVMALTPDSQEAVLLLGGDTFHADDDRAETPQSRHKLDVDGRQYKVLDRGIALIAEVVDRLLAKHERLTVRVLRGNHDPHSHMVLTFALAERYRDDPRAEVEKAPLDLFMKEWGRCLISAHHGDKGKPQELSNVISDICPYWSSTRHRFCFTGHVHHDSAKDLGPIKWESLRAFCPPDSYGARFATRRALQAITFDKQDGLVIRAMDPVER